MNTDFPRRANLELNTPAEIAIYEAIQKVEEVGAHPLLTDVVVMLSNAKEKLANYIDENLE